MSVHSTEDDTLVVDLDEPIFHFDLSETDAVGDVLVRVHGDNEVVEIWCLRRPFEGLLDIDGENFRCPCAGYLVTDIMHYLLIGVQQSDADLSLFTTLYFYLHVCIFVLLVELGFHVEILNASRQRESD